MKPKPSSPEVKCWGALMAAGTLGLGLSIGLWMLPLRYMVVLFLLAVFLTCVCLLLSYYFPAPPKKDPDKRRSS